MWYNCGVSGGGNGMKTSILYIKSKAFAIRIVRLYQYLSAEKKELIISKQLLRSGTSIGANIAEASRAISRSDFTAKVYISAKECAETLYWLELLHDTDYLSDAQFQSMNRDCRELERLLSASTKTLKSNP